KTAKYGKTWYDEDVHDLISVETKFPAIVFNDNLTSNETPSCEPTNEFPAIVYNDALTSKSDSSTEPTLCPRHIDEFEFKYETSSSEYDEEEQNVLYFNDLFPFNIIYPDDLKSDKGDDNNKIDMIQSSRGNENTQGSNNQLEESHDKISKVFIMRSFVMDLNVNIMAWNYLVNRMLFNLIKNLYVPLAFCSTLNGIIRMVIVQECCRGQDMSVLPRDQRHLWIHYQVEGYTEEIVHNFEQRLETVFSRQVNQVHTLDFEGLTPDMRQDLAERLRMLYTGDDGQEAPKKVTTTDLFYLCSMDRRAANVPYLLGQYFFRHAKGRKSGARLSEGHFIGRLAHHIGLVSDDGLRGLSIVTRKI
nr:hypothetical protein [Tanacetum cinerariifolium]